MYSVPTSPSFVEQRYSAGNERRRIAIDDLLGDDVEIIPSKAQRPFARPIDSSPTATATDPPEDLVCFGMVR